MKTTKKYVHMYVCIYEYMYVCIGTNFMIVFLFRNWNIPVFFCFFFFFVSTTNVAIWATWAIWYEKDFNLSHLHTLRTSSMCEQIKKNTQIVYHISVARHKRILKTERSSKNRIKEKYKNSEKERRREREM